MLRKIPMILLFVGLVVSLALIVGCSTKKPWEPSAAATLQVILVSGPDSATVVPLGSYASFNWIARGGSEKITGYQWYLEPLEADYNTASLATTAFYSNLTSGVDYIFHVRATDDAGNTALAERTFTVEPDTTIPTVMIDSSLYWLRGAYVATNSIVEFSWTGDDQMGNSDELLYQYIFTPTNDTSLWTTATSAVFNQVPAASPAVFKVRAKDPSDNISEWDTLAFTIRNATILYVDDYLWLDALGNTDVIKELEQKQFYRDVLTGYAYAEWDIARQGMPDSATLVQSGEAVYNSIVFASDSYGGNTDLTWWYDVGAVGGGVLSYYMENNGHLLVIGALALADMSQAYPPMPSTSDFEYVWLGIDTAQTTPDTAYPWDYWTDFTWATKDAGTSLDLPDSIKIDVAKNGTQTDYGIETTRLQAGTTVLFNWGLAVDGSEPAAYGHPIAHMTAISGNVRSAMINFNAFYMPKEDITRTFRAILGEFGE